MTHRRQIVGDDRCKKACHTIGIESLARVMELVGVEFVLVEIDAGVAVHLQIEKRRGGGHLAPCPPRPAARAVSSSLVHGRVRPAVAVRTSLTAFGSTGPAALPHCRRM